MDTVSPFNFLVVSLGATTSICKNMLLMYQTTSECSVLLLCIQEVPYLNLSLETSFS